MIRVAFEPERLQNRLLCMKQVLRPTSVLEVLFLKIQRIQIQMYPQHSIEQKYGAFYFNNIVRVHGLVFQVQLS